MSTTLKGKQGCLPLQRSGALEPQASQLAYDGSSYSLATTAKGILRTLAAKRAIADHGAVTLPSDLT